MSAEENPPHSIALTVDVEGDPARVEEHTRELLDLFGRARVRATFFILGEAAESCPGLVRAIAADAHEIGFHGYRHTALTTTRPESFAAELDEWLPRLEDVAQRPVSGYRAPFFSVGRETYWALQVLAGSSIQFDSSLYPGLHPRCGWRGTPTRPVRLTGTGLQLFPVPLLSRWVPVGFSGGNWLNAVPFPVVLRGLERRAASGLPGMVYLHPWQVPEQRGKVARLLSAFGKQLRPMGEALAAMPGLPEWSVR